MAGFNVQLWLRYKAQILYSILLPSTQSAAADALQADCFFFHSLSSPSSCFRSGSVSADWVEIYSFVKNLTDRFVRLVQSCTKLFFVGVFFRRGVVEIDVKKTVDY